MSVTKLLREPNDEPRFPVRSMPEARWAIRMNRRFIATRGVHDLERLARFILEAVHGGAISSPEVATLDAEFHRSRVYDDDKFVL